MSGVLAGLSGLYGVGVQLKNLAYDRGWCGANKLEWPVVSIGNVCAGGAGKTPVAIALAQLLKQRGVGVDVLSRGYGRRSSVAVEQVNPDGDAARFGDEPLLIARTAQVPVYVGASRWAAGRLAERARSDTHGRGVHLLDDGFQHRRLARNFDVVVMHPGDVADRLLPAGRLREPLQSLRRADAVVLREDDEKSEEALRRAGMAKPVWRVGRAVAVPVLAGPAVAFCGIARPDEFFDALAAAGVELVARLAFADHHDYTSAEIERICTAAASVQPQGVLLTTEKDLARLGAAARGALEAIAPLLPVPLVVTLAEAEGCVDALLAACGLSLAGERAGAAMRE